MSSIKFGCIFRLKKISLYKQRFNILTKSKSGITIVPDNNKCCFTKKVKNNKNKNKLIFEINVTFFLNDNEIKGNHEFVSKESG